MKEHVSSIASRNFALSATRNFFMGIGFLWSLTEISVFFTETLKSWLTDQWWLYVICALVWALVKSWPRKSFCFQLNDRDTSIELRIGDAFETKGALVVPTNSLFDSDLGGAVSRAQSVHGGLLRRYYHSKTDHLDRDIEISLDRQGLEKSNENGHEQEIGTVASIRQGNRLFYLVALTRVSNAGRALCEVEDYREALAKLWIFVGENGEKGTLVVPLLGTGHARLRLTREEVFKDLVRSFVVSCSLKTYCDKLVIVILPSDIRKFRLDVGELVEYLKLSCVHASYRLKESAPVGQAQNADPPRENTLRSIGAQKTLEFNQFLERELEETTRELEAQSLQRATLESAFEELQQTKNTDEDKIGQLNQELRELKLSMARTLATATTVFDMNTFEGTGEYPKIVRIATQILKTEIPKARVRRAVLDTIRIFSTPTKPFTINNAAQPLSRVYHPEIVHNTIFELAQMGFVDLPPGPLEKSDYSSPIIFKKDYMAEPFPNNPMRREIVDLVRIHSKEESPLALIDLFGLQTYLRDLLDNDSVNSELKTLRDEGWIKLVSSGGMGALILRRDYADSKQLASLEVTAT